MAGVKEMQVRLVVRGSETVLGDAASEAELFLTSDLLTRWVLLFSSILMHRASWQCSAKRSMIKSSCTTTNLRQADCVIYTTAAKLAWRL